MQKRKIKCYLVFTKSTGIADAIEELSTGGIFHNYRQMRGCQNHLQIYIPNDGIRVQQLTLLTIILGRRERVRDNVLQERTKKN